MSLRKRLINLILPVIAGFLGGALLWAPAGGGGQLGLMGADGEQRLGLGTYDGSYAKSETGLPFVGLSDNRQGLRLLFRLAGKNESPVLVFKDTRHRDRMVIGLGMSDAGEEPFIAFFDASGKKHLLMGRY